MSGERLVTASSFDSFEDATETAFRQIRGNPDHEGAASAQVLAAWVTKGGFVGVTQYHVQIVSPARISFESLRETPGVAASRISCKDWAAWYNRMPGAEDPNLRVTGTVELPSSSMEVALVPGNEGIVDEPDLLVLELIVYVPDFGDDRIDERTVSWIGRVEGIRRVRIQGACDAMIDGVTIAS